ncbi:MAG: ABC transporter ATP-binding protein [Firmicutes bacterium]|nr:ABC transporter ATP-binding protein [Bacillota bacterium]MBR6799500.1 ABC transporter ATP-binding protein [Bacillota bacterium]
MIYEVSNLTFSYPQGDRKVLDGASLQLDEGEILCILGPNGAGKTTLLNCMAGLLKAESGRINICGKDIKSMKEKEIASLIGYVPQIHTPAFDYKVLDFVLMGRAPKIGVFSSPGKEDEELCMNVLRSMGIDHIAHKSYMNISGGERQQAMIARTIVQEPKAILFDEPTAHLDYGNQHRVLKRVKQMAEEGYSVIITTHNPDHALMLDDKVAVVSRNGKIIQGESRDIITEDVLSEVYNIDLKITYVEEIGRKTCFVPGL